MQIIIYIYVLFAYILQAQLNLTVCASVLSRGSTNGGGEAF